MGSPPSFVPLFCHPSPPTTRFERLEEEERGEKEGRESPLSLTNLDDPLFTIWVCFGTIDH